MKKINKRLEKVSSAYDNNELDSFVANLDPQLVGNLLYLVEKRIRQIISYYVGLTIKAKNEVKTDYFLKTILLTIKEAETEQLKKWGKIKTKLEIKKKENGTKKEERKKKNNYQKN